MRMDVGRQAIVSVSHHHFYSYKAQFTFQSTETKLNNINVVCEYKRHDVLNIHVVFVIIIPICFCFIG